MALVSLTAAAACHAAPRTVVSVHEVLANMDRLNGRTVRVGGYLPECGGYDCELFANEADGRRWAGMLAILKTGRKPVVQEPEWLGIGFSTDFDRRAASLVGHYVVITGSVDNRCRYHGEPGCIDREPDIHPQSIQAWRPPSAPANVTPEKKA